MKSGGILYHRPVTRAVLAATAVPPNYSNTPYRKAIPANKPVYPALMGVGAACPTTATRAAGLAPVPVTPPCITAARGTTFIDPTSSTRGTSFNENYRVKSFRPQICATTDVALRPLRWHLQSSQQMEATDVHRRGKDEAAAAAAGKAVTLQEKATYGEILDRLSCRWAKKFYGKVTFGPRNYPYPSSRWLARRFQMKKHRILKRFRFRRYKLAAVANLPFARMIRVGMLPELKSSKSKKGDAVDMGLSSQLVSAARTSAGTGKTKGKRSRPRSKYQV